jgi:UDP-N-acetylglucosamine 2-epimerase (non-hydrolysing)
MRGLIEEESETELLFPVHPNPAVVEPAHRILGGHPRIHLIAPLSYVDFVLALQRARGVLTDSGGIQEEAPTFGTPVLVLREVTERPEGIEAGMARLVGTDPARILESAREILRSTPREGPWRGPAGAGKGTPSYHDNPYGDGMAAERIATRVEHFLGLAG